MIGFQTPSRQRKKAQVNFTLAQIGLFGSLKALCTVSIALNAKIGVAGQ